jgi:Fe-S-cluster-containing dehydrogenase component
MSTPEPATQYMRQSLYRDRWSDWGEETGIREISEMLSPDQLRAFELFEKYKDKFLIDLAPDVSVAVWKPGSVFFEEGTYIDVAFWIVEGEVEMFLARDGGDTSERPIFDLGRTAAIRPSDAADIGRTVAKGKPAAAKPGARGPQETVRYLATADVDVPPGTRAVIGPGEIFGEIGTLSGWPQSLTARARGDVKVVQIRLPALRQMKSRSKDLKERLDAKYRERQLDAHLQATPLLRDCSEGSLRALSQGVELVSCARGDVVAEEGTPAASVWLVRSGFVRVSQIVDGKPRVVTYLSKGMTFGEAEFLIEGVGAWTVTATSVEHSELVRIPHDLLRDLVGANPQVQGRLWEESTARLKEIGASRRSVTRSEFLDTALETGIAEGNSVLVIDLTRCTRCDDCVKGCADTHGGVPRFVREGDKYKNLLIAKSCYHCQDPVCLIGCPTGAIRRANFGDVVEIVEDQCIGCKTCANACPYDSIVMRDTGKTWSEKAVPTRLRGEPMILASKCDLCHTSPKGPACVYNCPNECAVRVGSMEEFQSLLEGR